MRDFSYLFDFLFLEESIRGIENILSELVKIEESDKVKLLEIIYDKINNIFNNYKSCSEVELRKLLDVIKTVEKKAGDNAHWGRKRCAKAVLFCTD